MKKIMTVLLFAAVAINVMAYTVTASAVLTLTASPSGETCELTVVEAAEFGALSGGEMNMSGRKVALYGINGATKWQTVQGADLSNLPLGLLTDASTSYTITISSLVGTLYLHDYVADVDYLLSEGTPYAFTATASTTNDSRFVLKKAPTASLNVCFTDNVLIINDNPYDDPIVIKTEAGVAIAGSPFAANSTSIDLSGLAAGRYTVEFAGGDRKFIIVK